MAKMETKVPGCYAAELGDCSGKLSREHFFSKAILEDFDEGGGLKVRGYPHGNDAGQFLCSVKSMSAKVLCTSHNNRLTDVDDEGAGFVLAFFEARDGLLGEAFATDMRYEFSGPLVERWMLKYLCGLMASGQAGFGPERVQKMATSPEVLRVLFGLDPMPDRAGLYTRAALPAGSVGPKGVALAPYLPRQPDGTRIAGGLRFEHYGFTSVFQLGAPQRPLTGTDLEGACYHPESFAFCHEPTGRSATIRLKWPNAEAMSGFVIKLHKDMPQG